MAQTAEIQEKIEKICSELNIDETSKRLANRQFAEITKTTILEVSPGYMLLGCLSASTASSCGDKKIFN